ncbi:MAG: hypothetical protein A3F31_04085 [Candidatus Levybacteria bacterium RIFCSPHIGHO2_12_FULL_38_12]|nr:MAG: hypothetical protein A3F31_04085 [Candidatus Levybacteria bacterium RIFCSPHIGHO2_12_FULL_38_12]OGH34377.1 MAG: hypothetical protein A3A47_04480 [Candidatus Levybacteria bacterium RIFCSPLOWO2_01_FULL_37_20]OGH44438.1 MAG: hypothetical protein A3J14_03230 [Candidatus Levybacteria bacterium RIFCSPLOWO2_02_FULL_37_18]
MQFHSRRIEFKYFLPADMLEIVIPFISFHMSLDKYIKDRNYYTVNSVYFDSPDLHCYHQKLAGVFTRKKYRIRYYNNDPRYYFFEIKRKKGDIVYKDRALLSSKLNLSSLNNDMEVKKNILNKIVDNALRSELINDYFSMKLHPMAQVVYKRKPFVSAINKNLRITIDYDIGVMHLRNKMIHGNLFSFLPLTLLEIKFNGLLPSWLGDMIKLYSFNRTAFSKYTAAIDNLVEHM